MADRRLIEVTQIANQSRIRFNDTNEVNKTLEDKLRTTAVSCLLRLSNAMLFPLRFFPVGNWKVSSRERCHCTSVEHETTTQSTIPLFPSYEFCFPRKQG